MTLREQLIQEVLDAPDFLVSALLKLLRLIRSGREGMAQKLTQLIEDVGVAGDVLDSAEAEGGMEPVLFYQGTALVVGGRLPEEFDVNQFMVDLREERIQEQMGL
jgi:hypothetical protein